MHKVLVLFLSVILAGCGLSPLAPDLSQAGPPTPQALSPALHGEGLWHSIWHAFQTHGPADKAIDIGLSIGAVAMLGLVTHSLTHGKRSRADNTVPVSCPPGYSPVLRDGSAYDGPGIYCEPRPTGQGFQLSFGTHW